MLKTPVLKIDTACPEPELIKLAAQALRCGQILILPTDTVYGIGLLVSAEANPECLFSSKQRSADKNIPLLVSRPEDLSLFGQKVPDYAKNLATAHWPGALTLVVRASDKVPSQFVGADGSIALRMPAHNSTLALLEAAGAPLACSSANLSGEPPALCLEELNLELANAVDLIIDGGSICGTSSAVVSCLQKEPQILRHGSLKL